MTKQLSLNAKEARGRSAPRGAPTAPVMSCVVHSVGEMIEVNKQLEPDSGRHLLLLSDSDLEAETVAGVALWWLTGAGTVAFYTLWEKNKKNMSNYRDKHGKKNMRFSLNEGIKQ